MRTYKSVIGDIALSCAGMGMAVNAEDVGFIVSTFLEALITQGPGEAPLAEPFVKFLQDAADACAVAKDEV